ncbi:kxDL motif-containing protein CG10681 [Topomyia yanbarensis]|uniref:kxDL motif-containing protein CG10681 n=1 Tax=Topomyia yanbarensis TaxID=2498891 RepID=UPI00273C400B|nr:kxDL motif-containing protein CG10681 [Topomyia yanbarensis]XP_058829977.1 kxDL motif-containing protein CG10681 [Topomyia yanbarensis]
MMNSEMSSSMHSGRPESEFSIECFQNYTAPEVFVQGLAGLVNQTDVEVIIRAQKQMLQRFEKTNEMLLNCNALSQSRLKIASEDFKKHTKLLHDMKKDLDYIFKKIRNIKTKLGTQYPTAFAEAVAKNKPISFDEEDEIDTASRAETLDERNSNCQSRTSTPVKLATGDEKKLLQKQGSQKKKSSASGAGEGTTTVSYMKMEQSPENRKSGKTTPIDPKRSSLLSTNSSSTDNSNDSSECTSDTG